MTFVGLTSHDLTTLMGGPLIGDTPPLRSVHKGHALA